MTKISNLYSLTNYITANSSGNVVIATPTSGFALDVTGTGRFTGQLTLGSTITNGTFTYTLPAATGTLALTSALGSYLPLSGGTLTGALVGTTATFNSNTGVIVGASSRAFIRQTAGGDAEMGAATGGLLSVFSNNSSVLSFAVGGGATFSSTLQAGAITSSVATGNGSFYINNASLTNKNWTLIPSTSGAETDLLFFYTGAAAGTRLTIANTGAATFSSTSSGGQNIRMQTSVAAGRNYLQWANPSGDMGYIGYGGADGKFYIINQLNDDMLFYTNSALRLTIAGSTGAATFTAIVGINGAIEAGWGLKVYENLKVQNNNGTTVLQVADISTGGKAWSLISAGASNVHTVPAGNFYLRNSTDGVTAFSILPTTGNIGFGRLSARGKAEFVVGLPTSIPTFTNTTNGVIVSDGGAIYARIGVSNFSGAGAGYPAYIQAGDFDGATYYNLLLNPLGGNVGIGTTSPSYKLEVRGAATTDFRIVDSGDVGFQMTSGSTSNAFSIRTNGSTIVMSTQNSRSLNIGVNASSGDVVGSTTGLSIASGGGVTFASFIQATNATFAQAGTTSLYLSNTLISAGNSSGVTGLYMGDAGSGINTLTREKQAVNVARTVIYSEQGYNVQSVGAFFQAGAAYQGNNSTTWAQISDARIKENVRPISDSLDKLLALNPCHFEYKTNLGKTKTGFIAQEFEQVLPGHVIESPVGLEHKEFIPEEGETIKSIDADLIPYLVKAIQELSAKVTALENK